MMYTDPEVLAELAAAHKRIEMLVERVMNLEHYLGLRSHSFDNHTRKYRYHQVVDDVIRGKRPKEINVPPTGN